LYQPWFKTLFQQKGNQKVGLRGAIQALDILFNGDDQLSNVLIVAAAGNDSQTGYRADPRIPAIVEGVLGVSAAVPLQGQPGKWRSVAYSNADDLLAPDDGISAFGGDVDHAKGGAKDGPIALYLSNDLPGGNTEGLAQWCGTSFATPIASGYAACIWSAALNEIPAGSTDTVEAAAVRDAVVFNPDGSSRRAIPLGYR
jgi:subtilisin family serine protease